MFPFVLARGFSSATVALKGPLAIVIRGKTSEVSAAVTTGLQPHYIVTHSILSSAAGIRDLPGFLRRGPDTTEKPTTPIAVLVGGEYTDDDLKSMKDACVDSPSVIWLKVQPKDMSGSLPSFAEYGAEVGKMAKSVLNELRSRGELGKGQTLCL